MRLPDNPQQPLDPAPRDGGSRDNLAGSSRQRPSSAHLNSIGDNLEELDDPELNRMVTEQLEAGERYFQIMAEARRRGMFR